MGSGVGEPGPVGAVVQRRPPPCHHTLRSTHDVQERRVSWPDWLGYGEGQAPRDYTPKNLLEFERRGRSCGRLGLESFEQ